MLWGNRVKVFGCCNSFYTVPFTINGCTFRYSHLFFREFREFKEFKEQTLFDLKAIEDCVTLIDLT